MGALVLPGRESRKLHITIEVEAACVASMIESGATPVIERVRFADGKWRKASLFITRLEALGVNVDMASLKVGGPGSHTPVY